MTIKLRLILLFSILTILLFGQRLDKQTKKYLKSRLDTVEMLDQKYRWHLTYQETDTRKVDSIKKLPPEIRHAYLLK